MPIEARFAALAAGVGATAAASACLGRCLATTTASASATSTTTAGTLLPASLDDFMIEPGLRYLNTGTLGPSPRSVIAAVTAELEFLAANPLNNYFGGGEHAPGTERME